MPDDDPTPSSNADRVTTVDGLIVHLDTPLPKTLTVGRGRVLYLSGRCYHPVRSIRSLHVVVDGVPHPIVNHSQTRSDVPSDDPMIGDTVPNSLTSGFWVGLPFSRITAPRSVDLSWWSELDDGGVCIASLGTLRLLPGNRGPLRLSDAAEPRVAICMTTYNPDPPLFAVQVASIVRQRHQNWLGIISDDDSAPESWRAISIVAASDPRFQVVRNGTRLGPYANVERALSHVPLDAEFVALPAHDEVWHPDKLTRMLAVFRPETTLVHGASDRATPDGVEVQQVERVTRPQECRDLATLVFDDTVSAAASVFRATLLVDVLPFPPPIGNASFDHWIACTALTKGEVTSVDAPLQAHDQDDTTIAGHRLAPAPRLQSLAELRVELRRRVMATLWRRREAYANDVVRLIVMARTLLLRLGETTTAAKRATLERLAALEKAPFGLVREMLAALLGGRPTVGVQWHYLSGMFAARVLDGHYRRNRHRLFEERVVRHEITGVPTTPSATAGVTIIDQKTAPLRLRPDADERRRVNLIMPAIDVEHLFAGYLGKLNLALRLTDAGHAVRLVIVDPCDYDPPTWRRTLTRYPGLESLVDRVEVAYVADRAVDLPVHPRDAFVATTWWTAHIAHRAGRELGRRRFVYLIQEFEPMTFPMGSFHALAAESYALPHVALFSTDFLRDYFRAQRLGVYADDLADGEACALSFQNAIATFAVTADTLARTGRHKLLFYARPEQHAARNMFEIGILALRRVIAAGTLDPSDWVVEGLGASRAFAPVPLGRECQLSLLPRVSLAEYQTILPGYDVGLSLMLTPHPSLVPLEMAAAGLVTVTNSFANKTVAALAALSANLVPVPPTIDGIAGGLTEAIGRADDLDRRVSGSRVAWSRRWEESFDAPLLQRLSTFLADDEGHVG